MQVLKHAFWYKSWINPSWRLDCFLREPWKILYNRITGWIIVTIQLKSVECPFKLLGRGKMTKSALVPSIKALSTVPPNPTHVHLSVRVFLNPLCDRLSLSVGPGGLKQGWKISDRHGCVKWYVLWWQQARREELIVCHSSQRERAFYTPSLANAALLKTGSQTPPPEVAPNHCGGVWRRGWPEENQKLSWIDLCRGKKITDNLQMLTSILLQFKPNGK